MMDQAPRRYSFLAPPTSAGISSLPPKPKCKSRFTEHISQAYTAPPPNWTHSDTRNKSAQTRSSRPLHNHKYSRSVESFSSTSSTSSASSFRRLKEFITDKSAKLRPRAASNLEAPPDEYYIKGSHRRFTKDDIKFGRLMSTTNLYI